MELRIKELTQENFKDYGSVIEYPDSEPTAVMKGLRCWHHVSVMDIPNNPHVGLLEITKQDLVFTQIERHLHSNELFNPVQGQGVMIFAPAGEFDVNKMEAFLLDGTKSLTVNTGVWHFPPKPITDKIVLTMVFPEDIVDDCELVDIPDTRIVL